MDPAAPLPASDALPHILLALVVVIVVARLVGAVFRRFGQPPVIGEILAGILLGPSLLGRVAPSVYQALLPPSVASSLAVISQIGIILYMFLVGMELDTTLLRRRTTTSLAVAGASIAVPFVLGVAMAFRLHPRFSSPDVPFTAFALFMGVSLSVTAFPVLARILTDRGMQNSPTGALALACAAVGDVGAWCLLALLVGYVQARPGAALVTVALAAVYVVAMLAVVRPLARRLVRAHESRAALTDGMLAIVCVALLISALATERIGIHALFGAFLLGALVRHDSGLARALHEKLHGLVVVLMLPPFFAFTGLRTDVRLLSGGEEWLICAGIVAVASAGKLGGSAVAARLTGEPWREAAALGVLMNTRGLMELIVLNVGLDLGLLSPTLFAMLVLMALLTTLATTPLLDFVQRGVRVPAAGQ
jgi:Kef-type K+ transport system membrane component KefB